MPRLQMQECSRPGGWEIDEGSGSGCRRCTDTNRRTSLRAHQHLPQARSRYALHFEIAVSESFASACYSGLVESLLKGGVRG